MLAKLNHPSLATVRFALVGVFNTCSGLLVIYALKWTLDLHDVLANLAGYAVGLCISYVLNARWTFRYQGSLLSAANRFLATVAIAYAANLATVWVAIYALGLNSYLAHALGVIPYAGITYLLSKFFVFHRAPAVDPAVDRANLPHRS